MQAPIFVSHATEDRAVVALLCEELKALGIELWVSFQDIQPGSQWDKAIQNALEKATHVIVAVSKASTESLYVRTEVEYALDHGKTVIPVVIEPEVKIPLRWYTLQNVNWRDRSKAALLQLAGHLPKTSLMRFEEYLGDPVHGEELRQLLVRNPQWIHPDARVNTNPSMRRYDFAHTISNTGGTSKFLYYLCSPYQPPFTPEGQPSSELKQTLEQAKADAWPGQQTRQLGYYSIEIHLFAGQRSHYTNTMYQHRDRLIESLPQQWMEEGANTALRLKVWLDIASYTRLLEDLKERAKQHGDKADSV
jgi:hypothetical protein